MVTHDVNERLKLHGLGRDTTKKLLDQINETAKPNEPPSHTVQPVLLRLLTEEAELGLFSD